jgi:hypothetical protein
MPEAITNVINFLVVNLLQPLLLIAIPVVIFKAKQYAERITSSTEQKNAKETEKLTAEAKATALERLTQVVGAAVASTQRLANEMRSDGTPLLTNDEISELNQKARDLVHKMLPGGTTMALLGGKQVFDTLIDSLMERQLLEIKVQEAQIEAAHHETTVTDFDPSAVMYQPEPNHDHGPVPDEQGPSYDYQPGYEDHTNGEV